MFTSLPSLFRFYSSRKRPIFIMISRQVSTDLFQGRIVLECVENVALVRGKGHQAFENVTSTVTQRNSVGKLSLAQKFKISIECFLFLLVYIAIW